MSAFGVSIPSTIAFPGNHSLGGHSSVQSSSSGHHSTVNHSAGTSSNHHSSGSHSIASLSSGNRGGGSGSSNRANAMSSNSNNSNHGSKNQEKNELTKACEANSNRVSYLPSALPSQPGFTRVVLDGKYTGYMRCVTCTDKVVLIKVRGDGNDYNFGRHNQKCHSKDGSGYNRSSGSGFGHDNKFRADKEEVIQAMYKEPERIQYEGSGIPNLPGFQKVFVDGKYTGYMRCTNCTTKIALIKEKRKKDGTSYGGIFGVSNLVKHNASVHEGKKGACMDLTSDSDSDCEQSHGGKRKRSNKDMDRKIKELKVKRLTTDIKEKEQRMREAEDRARYMQKMDEKIDKMVKMHENILDGINRLNHIVNGSVR